MAVGGLNTKGAAITLPPGGELYIPGGAVAFWHACFVRIPDTWPNVGVGYQLFGYSGNVSGTGGNDRLVKLRPDGGATNLPYISWVANRSGVALVDSSNRAVEYPEGTMELNDVALIITGRQISPTPRLFRVICRVGGEPEVIYTTPANELSSDWTYDLLGDSLPADDYSFERLGMVLGEFPATDGDLDLAVIRGLANGTYKSYDDPSVLAGGALERYYGLTNLTDVTDTVSGESIDTTGLVKKSMIAPWSAISIKTKTKFVAVNGLGALNRVKMGINKLAGKPAIVADSVTNGDITITFADLVGVGEYANGDKYIYDIGNGITLTGPTSSGDINGAMVNVTPGYDVSQGFDYRMQNSTYDSSLNVARQLPYTLNTGDSLFVSKSHADIATGDNPQLEELAVFIVEDATNLPPANSFRPNMYGGPENRIHKYTIEDLDWSILGNYAIIDSYDTMDLDSAKSITRKPYMEYQHSWISRYTHASNNQSPYGREIANDLAGAVIVLNSDYTRLEKKQLFIQCVQNGLDAAGANAAGQIWLSDGGHNLGRKTTIVLAAAALNDASLVPALTDMQDDAQIFVVSQTEVDLTQSGLIANGGTWNPDSRDIDDGKIEAYEAADIGLPEWGIRHNEEPERDNAHLDAKYRDVNGAPICRTALAVNMFGGKTLWGNDTYFDYADRYQSEIGLSNWTNDLWTAYRASLP